MKEMIQQKLSDSKSARWTALVIVSVTMMFGYFFQPPKLTADSVWVGRVTNMASSLEHTATSMYSCCCFSLAASYSTSLAFALRALCLPF